MKQFYFFIMLLLASGAIHAQEKLSKEEQQRREKNEQAANPFAKFGYKAKVATLSKGKYLEVHDLDSIVTIGSVRFYVDKNEIVEFIQPDSIYEEYSRPIGDVASRWLSPDPLAEEFPSWSPYAFVYNNPLKFNDPTGMAPEEADFKPDKNGNLIVEKGDTAEKLKQQYGVTVADKDFKFKEGNVILLDNNMTRSIETSNKSEDYNVKTDCYNCHGAATAVVTGKEVTPDTAGFKGSLFEPNKTGDAFRKDFKELSATDKPTHGKTVLSFGDHSAVYYGTDNGGTQYYYSKNGATNKPAVFSLSDLKSFYPDNPNPKMLNYEPKKTTSN